MNISQLNFKIIEKKWKKQETNSDWKMIKKQKKTKKKNLYKLILLTFSYLDFFTTPVFGNNISDRNSLETFLWIAVRMVIGPDTPPLSRSLRFCSFSLPSLSGEYVLLLPRRPVPEKPEEQLGK